MFVGFVCPGDIAHDEHANHQVLRRFGHGVKKDGRVHHLDNGFPGLGPVTLGDFIYRDAEIFQGQVIGGDGHG